MTQDSLKHLSLDQLYDLLVLIIDEYKALQKKIHNSDATEIKKAEIQFIQKAIDERKNKLNPTL